MLNQRFLKEAGGLSALQQKLKQHNIPIKIPHINAVDESSLVLDYINHTGGEKIQWQQFGNALAQLHLQKQAAYGWHENNYIGLNPQTNVLINDWGVFFVHYRLAHQINLIADSAIQSHFKQSLSLIEAALIVFLNNHCQFPSLLHGDLWSGNVLFDDQAVWLIDPAVYCGDAETDLAMTELFGGFPAVFYQAYFKTKPQSSQYALKKTIYNLYHQLNHYNLFGDSYLASCEHGFEVMSNNL